MAQVINNSEKQPNRVGSGFTNLQRFLDVNKQNRLGQAVASGVQGVATGARQALGQSQQQFQQKAESQRLDTEANQQRVKDVLNQAPELVGTGPNRTEEQQKNLRQFTQFREGKYAGPQELQDAQALKARAQEGQQLGQATGTAGGRVGLLQRFAGGPRGSYGAGAQSLDSMLLERQKDPLAQARRQTQSLGQEVTSGEQAARLLAQNLGQKAQQFGQKTLEQLTGKTEEVENPLQKTLTDTSELERKRALAVQDIRSLLSMQGTQDVYDPKTGKLIRKGEGGPGSEGDALTKALNLAGQYGMITSSNVSRLEDIARKVQTPIERMILQQQQSGPGGILGYGGAAKGQTFEYADTPITSGLNMRDLLREHLLQKEAENVSRGGVSSKDEKAKLNALQALAGKQEEFANLEDPNYKAGAAGFDIDAMERAVNERIANLRKEKLVMPTQVTETPIYERIRRGLMPTFDESVDDYSSILGGKNPVTGQGLSINDAIRLGLTPARAQAGVVINPMINAGQGVIQGTGQIIQGDLGAGGANIASSGALLNSLSKAATSGTLNPYSASGLLDSYNTYKEGGQKLLGGDSTLGDRISGLGQIATAPIVTAAKGFERVGNVIRKIPVIGGAIGGAASSVGGFLRRVFSDEELKHQITSADFDIKKMLDKLEAKNYDYKDGSHGEGRKTGIIAQDLEKSSLGKRFVENTDEGKMVDYTNMGETMLAGQAHLNKRLNRIESLLNKKSSKE